MTTQGPPTQFRDDRIESELDKRRGDTSRGLAASKQLERYFDLLDRSRPTFTEPEAVAIIDALQGVGFFDTAAPYAIGVEVADNPETLISHLGGGADSLTTRLESLAPAELLALTDAVEQIRLMMVGGVSARSAVRQVGIVE